MNRRFFLRDSALTLGAISLTTPAFTEKTGKESFSSIRFGICADLHQDIIFDAKERLNPFVDEMLDKKPEFIIIIKTVY